MFRLDLAIKEWRRQMATEGIESDEVLDELEAHLRDDVDAQLRSGVDAERAFDSAVGRIGTAFSLGTEFAKSSRAVEKPGRRSMKTAYFAFAAVAILIDIWTLISFELSGLELLAGSCGVALLAFYLLRLPFSKWLMRGVPHPRLLVWTKAASLIVPLWTLWALLTALGVIRFDVGIITAMVMWSFCAAFGLTALACCFNDDRSGEGGALPPLVDGPRFIPPSPPRPPDFDIPGPPSKVFTPVAQQALSIAREEALLLGHDYIGTEHVLLGVLKMAKGALAKALQGGKVDDNAVRMEICRLIAPLHPHPVTTRLPITPRARKALQFAKREADALKLPMVSAEHVLVAVVLGLLLEGNGVAALALNNLGIRIEPLRKEISGASAHS